MTYRLAGVVRLERIGNGPTRETFYAIGPNGPVASFISREDALDWIAERNADPCNPHAVTLDEVQEVVTPQRVPLSERLAQTLRYLQSGASSGKASPKP